MKKITIILFCLFLFGCKSLAYYYNYGGMKSVEELKKETNDFYSKETPEQKKLRKINRKICDDISGAYSGNWDQVLYRNCMKERGSPLP